MGHSLNTRGKEGRTQESSMEELSFRLNYENGYNFSKQMVAGGAGISRFLHLCGFLGKLV